MANLLDQASIVLTPTAYDNGKVLCAKPSEPPYGDFDFSRNSAATRVNAQGLVENVQILSSNLVQNGDFSEEGSEEVSNGSFSQEGSEEITNGDFSSDTGWTKSASGVTISGGSANFNSSTDAFVLQNALTVGKTYKATFSGTITSGSFYVGDLNNLTNTYPSGTYINEVAYFTAVIGDTRFIIRKTGSGDFIGSIDNVSVREVGQDWTLGTGWSIGEDKAVCDGTNSADIRQVGSIVGKTYKATLSVSENNVGRVNVYIGGAFAGQTTNGATGDFTFYAKATDTNLIRIRSNNSFNGSITNISVKEVGQNWTLGTGWSIGEDKLTFDSNDIIGNPTTYSNAFILATPFVVGKKYRVTLTDLEILGGAVEFKFGREYNTNPARPILTSADNGTYVDEFVAVSTADRFTINNGSARTYGSIGSVSAIEITDDTNLPRINYEGFSYQDALGSELVTNGDFDNGSTGWLNVGQQNANNTNTFSNGKVILVNDGTGSGISQPNILEIGKTYQVEIVVSEIVGNGFKIYTGTDYYITNTGTFTLQVTSTINNVFYLYRNQTNPQAINGATIDNVSVKEVLGQEVVPDSGCGSWLFEPQSTNLIPYSSDYTQWLVFDVDLTSDNIISPDGTLSGTLAASTGAPFDQIKINTTASGDATFSMFVKKLTDDTIDFEVRGVGIGGSAGSQMRFTFSTEQLSLISNGVPSSTLVENYGNGWFRISLTYLGTTSISSVSIFPSYASSTIRSAYIWGAMLEENSYPTSLIPTSGSTVTRNQDLCTNGGSLASINSTEGVLYAEIAALANDLTDRDISISDGTNNNVVRIRISRFSNNIGYAVLSNGVTTGGALVSGQTQTNTNKIAVKYKQDDFALWVNGVEVATDTSGNTPIGLSSLQFTTGNVALPFFGKTKALAVWKEALSDAELVDLTYPTPTDPTFALDFDTIATDFTFARGSEATYVDAQGLIQSTNEIGSELVVNGTFDTDLSGWNNSNNYWQWSSQGAYFPLTTTHNPLSQVITNDASAVLKFTFTLTIVQGTANVYYQDLSNATVSQQFTQSGTYTIYTVPVKANTSINFSRYGGINTEFYIDNVSVKEYITATNTPRLDYSTGAEAFLLEPQSTNLITYSEDFSDASWIGAQTSATVTASTNINPSGGSGTYFVEYVTGSQLGAVVSVTAGLSYTGSFYVRNVSGSGAITLRDVNSVTTAFTATDEWQRFSVTGVAIGPGRLYINVLTTGDVIEVWGAQLEQQSYATSYIPTSGTSVTRNQETCINATPEINSEEGVLYAEISALADDQSYRYITLSDGTTSNYVVIRYYNIANKISAFIENTSGVQGSTSHSFSPSETITNFHKVAFKWRANDFALWIDGTEVSTQSSGTTFSANVLNKLQFNEGDGSGNGFFGNTKDVQVYTKALSDAELIKLTT